MVRAVFIPETDQVDAETKKLWMKMFPVIAEAMGYPKWDPSTCCWIEPDHDKRDSSKS